MKAKQSKFALVSILAFSLTVFLGKGDSVLLRGIDSNIHAAVALNTTSQGWIPRLPMPLTPTEKLPDSAQRNLDPRYFFNDHPFFPFWLNGWVMRALGPSAWSARVVTAVSSVGCVFLTYLIGCALDSALFGVLAALILSVTRDFVLTSATMSLDTTMLFFILLSFLMWLKRRWVWLGVFGGLGLWIKTPIVLLVYPTAFVVSWIQGDLKKDAGKLLGAFWVSLGIGSLVWGVTGYLGGGYLVKDYWMRQVWGTAVGGRQQIQGRDWFMFLDVLKLGFMPGLPLLLYSLFKIGRKWNGKILKESRILVPLVASLILIAAVSLLRFKLGHYFTPAFPFLALLSSYALMDFLRKREEKFYGAITLGTPVLLSALLASPVSFGPEAFLSLKRFMPYIQSYGKCEDPVLLVQGGEPIGGSLDYQLVLNFYTNHPVEVTQCSQAASLIEARPPEWIILSEEHLRDCLTPTVREQYPTRLLAGNLYLLSHSMPSHGQLDLTPLERELRPSVNCTPPPLSNDLYHRYSSLSKL